MSTADDLRERLKLRYMGDCKCGHCALVPDELVARAAEELDRRYSALEKIRWLEGINPSAFKIALEGLK